MNELAIIFDRMEIDTTDVLEAAGTKWNFLKFKPNLCDFSRAFLSLKG